MDALFGQLNLEKLEINPTLVENDKISKCYDIITNRFTNLKIEIAFLRENADNQSEDGTIISSSDDGNDAVFRSCKTSELF